VKGEGDKKKRRTGAPRRPRRKWEDGKGSAVHPCVSIGITAQSIRESPVFVLNKCSSVFPGFIKSRWEPQCAVTLLSADRRNHRPMCFSSWGMFAVACLIPSVLALYHIMIDSTSRLNLQNSLFFMLRRYMSCIRSFSATLRALHMSEPIVPGETARSSRTISRGSRADFSGPKPRGCAISNAMGRNGRSTRPAIAST
jgi:hypothetical protein